MSKRKVVSIATGKQNIGFLFTQKTNTLTGSIPEIKEALPSQLKSEDTLVEAFYKQLSPSERTAHTLAVELLGSSYDVRSTHGYIRWKRLLDAPK
jgi:HPt (histidine-containing phosphotransfer) domain-containing protein